MDYYLLKENEIEPEEKYFLFNRWCKKEGVIMPKAEYPCFFDDGLKGMRAKEDIANREVFMYIPYKMLINLKMVEEDKKL